MNLDFQDAQVRNVAQEVVEHTTNVITAAIVERLGIESEYQSTGEDGTIEKLPVEFDRAYRLLKEAGETVNHEFVEENKNVVLKIRFFKLDQEISYDVKSAYEYSLTKRA